MAKKAAHLDSLLQLGNRLEELERGESQEIVVKVIRADPAPVDPPETPGPRNRKCLHSPHDVGIAVVLPLGDFRARSFVVRALQMTAVFITNPDRGMHWLDPEGLEVQVNPLPWFVLRAEIGTDFEVRIIPKSATRTINPTCCDLDGALVVDVAAALPRQVGNDSLALFDYTKGARSPHSPLPASGAALSFPAQPERAIPRFLSQSSPACTRAFRPDSPFTRESVQIPA
jgi:hypothetical protein